MYDLPDAPWIRDAEQNGMPEPDSYVCPICGAENPERFFLQSEDIVGCSDCIDDEQAEDVVYKYPWLFDGYRGED